MSDDLAAKAANWVPPWQRPADGQSEDQSDVEAGAGVGAEAADEAAQDDGEGPTAGPELPAQWDRLAGAKWQNVSQDELSDDEPLDDGPLDPEVSDPQLSDCVSESDNDDSEGGSEGDWDDEPSWNARVKSPDTDSKDTDSEDAGSEDAGSEDAQAELLSGDGPGSVAQTGDGAEESARGDAEPSEDEPAVALSGDERGVRALSGEAGAAGSGDERGVRGLSGDAGAARLSGDARGLAGDENGALGGDENGALSGDAASVAAEAGGGKSGGKRSRGRKSGDAEGQAQDAGSAADGFEQGQLFVPAQRVPEDRPSITEAELVPALEAILMVVDEPVSEIVLAQVLEVPAEQVADALLRLSATYTQEGKGFDLRRAAGGWRFYTRAEYSPYVERFVLDGQQLRLTQASLETLAVVAYKQPVTRSRISAIRGVNCDGVVRTLVTRGLIEECGTEPESGAHLYRTTNLFLEKLGLDSVEQLPPLAPFLPDNLDEVALNE